MDYINSPTVCQVFPASSADPPKKPPLPLLIPCNLPYSPEIPQHSPRTPEYIRKALFKIQRYGEGSVLDLLSPSIEVNNGDPRSSSPFVPSALSLFNSLGTSVKSTYIPTLRDKNSTFVFQALCRNNFDLKKIERYFQCGKFYAVKRCRACGEKQSVIASYCDERYICEICSVKRRFPRLMKRYLPLFEAIFRRSRRKPSSGNPSSDKPTLVMITFTEKGDNTVPDAVKIRAHNRAVRKFMSVFCPKSKGYGGFGANHFQGVVAGTHLNTHVLAWAPWLDRDEVIAWWKKERATGAWYVDIREIHKSARHTANHVLGYAVRGAVFSKDCELSELERFAVRLALNQATKNVRTIHTYGSFYNAHIPKALKVLQKDLRESKKEDPGSPEIPALEEEIREFKKSLLGAPRSRCIRCGGYDFEVLASRISKGECEAMGAVYIGDVEKRAHSPPYKEGDEAGGCQMKGASPVLYRNSE